MTTTEPETVEPVQAPDEFDPDADSGPWNANGISGRRPVARTP